MGKLEICCSSLCGFCGKVLRAKASLRALMFLCFFWTTFNIVLSSMTVTPLLYTDHNFVMRLPCSVSDWCMNGCQNFLGPPKPTEMIVSGPDDLVYMRLVCPWPVSANASRFCCAICCIIMFTGMLFWAFRRPNSKPSKLFYVIPFIGADIWWWAVMFTDATELAKLTRLCKKETFFTSLSPSSLVVSVRFSQRFLLFALFPYKLRCSVLHPTFSLTLFFATPRVPSFS
jgi:hypothetical protein